MTSHGLTVYLEMKSSEHRHKVIWVYVLSFKVAFRGQTKVESIHDAEFQLELTEDEDTDRIDPEAVDNVDEPSGSSGDVMTSFDPANRQPDIAVDFEELDEVEPEADDWDVAPVDCNQSEYTDIIRE